MFHRANGVGDVMGNAESQPVRNVDKRTARRDHAPLFSSAVQRYRALSEAHVEEPPPGGDEESPAADGATSQAESDAQAAERAAAAGPPR